MTGPSFVVGAATLPDGEERARRRSKGPGVCAPNCHCPVLAGSPRPRQGLVQGSPVLCRGAPLAGGECGVSLGEGSGYSQKGCLKHIPFKS